MVRCRVKLSWLLVLVLMVVACKSKEEAENSALEASETESPKSLDVPDVDSPKLLESLDVRKESGPLTLKHQRKPRLAHRVTMEQWSRRTAGDKVLENGIRQEFTLSKVMEPLDDGESGWTVNATVKKVNVTPIRDSKEKGMSKAVMNLVSALEGQRFNYVTDSSGAIRQFEVPKSKGPFAKAQEALKPIVEDAALVLPDHPVSPGDSWDSSRTTVMEHRRTENRIEYDLKTTFLGIASIQGRCDACVVLRTQGKIHLEGTIKSDFNRGSTRGVGKTDSVVVFDPESGLIVDAEMHSSVAQQFTISRGEGEVTLSESNKMSLVQKWIQEESEPSAGR